MRKSDARPDEVAVIPEDKGDMEVVRSCPTSNTLVEKIDVASSSHGELPGTLAYEKRAADAVPDLVLKSGERHQSSNTRAKASSTSSDLPIPITKVEKVDSMPSHGEVPGTEAFELRKEDAEPDIVEEVGDVPGKDTRISWTPERSTESGSPTSRLNRSSIVQHARRKSSGAEREASTNGYNEEGDDQDDGFGDDFDDFEEGEHNAEFGDFDDGFQESQPAPPLPQPIAPILSFVGEAHYIRCIYLTSASPFLTSLNSTPQKKSIPQWSHT